MKARIMSSANERLIAYKQQENLAALAQIADKLRIKLVIAEDDSADTPIGYFAGLNGFAKSEKSCESKFGCLVLAGLSDSKINSVLSEIKKAHLSIPLKAILTPMNRSWSIKKLSAELAQERERLGG
ncbi:MAG: DUF3783 domain-containing protein [Oscillospiraceae bacterium]